MMVLVLGCGPAGLMAAHAAALADSKVAILSHKQKSKLFGAQYLHAPIPLATPSDADVAVVNYELRGTIDGYRQKVYPDQPDVQVSPETLGGLHHGWDLRATYERLWGMYGHAVTEFHITPDTVQQAIKDLQADLVVSTVPAPALCSNGHNFRSQQVQAFGDAPELNRYCPISVKESTVVVDGTQDVSWYRASNIFGYKTVEWPAHVSPPIPGVSSIRKPIDTDCDCMPAVMRSGRFGKWRKGVLSHETFAEVSQALAAVNAGMVPSVFQEGLF